MLEITHYLNVLYSFAKKIIFRFTKKIQYIVSWFW